MLSVLGSPRRGPRQQDSESVTTLGIRRASLAYRTGGETMNWEAIGAVGEALGALVVMVSVVTSLCR